MLRSLTSRLRRLEQAHTLDDLPGEGLAVLLAYADRHNLRPTPIKDCTDAELDAKIAALAGQRGLSLPLRACYEEERARRQAALVQESPV